MESTIEEVDVLLTFQAVEKFEGGLENLNAYMRDLKKNCPVGMGRLVLPEGGITPLDQHYVKEAWFVAQGFGELIYREEQVTTIKPGDIVVFDENEKHILKNTGSGNLVFFSVWWD